MASSATTTAFAAATTSLRRHNLAVEMSFSNNYISFFKKPLVKFSVRTSSDDDASSSLAAAAEAEPIDESSIEVPKGPPLLISALNVEKALRGIAITDVDHYGILGLKKGCSYDQESYSILSSVEERRLYDWSLARNENVDRYAWPFEVDITQTETVNSPDTPPPQEPENVEPTRLVGYFLLTWIILSITLSVAFNR